jgi:hypothetical protein
VLPLPSSSNGGGVGSDASRPLVMPDQSRIMTPAERKEANDSHPSIHCCIVLVLSNLYVMVLDCFLY